MRYAPTFFGTAVSIAMADRKGASKVCLRDLVVNKKHEIVRLATNHGVTNVSVFGSAVRGDDGPGSDIDLLVEFEEGRSLFDLIRLRDALTALLGRPVDVVTKDALHWRIKDEVLKEAFRL